MPSNLAPTVTWGGAFNAVDLGGLPLETGGSTVAGRLYRSGRPDQMTDEGWRQAKAEGLRLVVDLRNPSEIGREAQHPPVGDATLTGIARVNLPTEDPDDPEFRRICSPRLDSRASYPDNLAFYPEKFAAVFRAILGADGAVLVHCSAGRDRTGLVTALLLRLAGVPVETIADDYEAAVRRVNAHLWAMHEPRPEPAHTDDALRARIEDRRAALVSWLQPLDVVRYLGSIGLSPAEIGRLSRLLT
ncbi:MAG: tyrosine-protein phosphatase [Actinomycetota bacterium]